MQTARLSHLRIRRRRWASLPDFGTFFLFFGISGIDEHGEARRQKRFEREYYANLAAVRLSAAVPPGRYALVGLPDEANRRGWRVGTDGTATTELSDDALRELRAWMDRGERQVSLQPLPRQGD